MAEKKLTNYEYIMKSLAERENDISEELEESEFKTKKGITYSLDYDILDETSKHIGKEDILINLERSSYNLSKACSGLSRIEYFRKFVNKNIEFSTEIEYRNQIAEYIAELMMLIYILVDQYDIVSYDAIDSYSIARQEDLAKVLNKIKKLKEELK